MPAGTLTYYEQQFRHFEQNGGGTAPPWMHALRSSALSNFLEKGFPTTKDENWRFTSIAPLSEIPFRYSSSKDVPWVSASVLKPLLIHGHVQHSLVFINGVFSKELSNLENIPRGVAIGSLAAAVFSHPELIQEHFKTMGLSERNSFASLNTAFLSDGAFVLIPKDMDLRDPLHLLFLSVPGEGKDDVPFAAHPRNLIILEEGSRANILESYFSLSGAKNLTNAVSEVVVKERAAVEYVKVQRENDSSYHFHTIAVDQKKESIAGIFSLALGGSIARNDIGVTLDGEKADCNLNGLYIATGEELVDHHTFIHHIHPECPSHELFKGILHGHSRAVFNGKVYVNPEAQKTDSKQTNRNLLLSDTATIDTKPELEIFADDVKCTHGATVGGIDELMLYYLKSRGVGESTARGILTVGFAAEVTEKINSEVLRHHVDRLTVELLKNKLGYSDLPVIVHGHHE